MSKTYTTQRRVEFRDTDAAGIMHFSVFFTMMEQVEHEFLRHLGLSVIMPSDSEDAYISWPRVSAHCEYVAPVGFDDVLDVTLSISSIGNKSVRYQFDFAVGDTSIASGYLVAVCCEVTKDAPPESMPIPKIIRDTLGPFA